MIEKTQIKEAYIKICHINSRLATTLQLEQFNYNNILQVNNKITQDDDALTQSARQMLLSEFLARQVSWIMYEHSEMTKLMWEINTPRKEMDKLLGDVDRFQDEEGRMMGEMVRIFIAVEKMLDEAERARLEDEAENRRRWLEIVEQEAIRSLLRRGGAGRGAGERGARGRPARGRGVLRRGARGRPGGEPAQ